jgi:hypothetical protein
VRINFNDSWSKIQATEGAPHWTSWISLSTNVTYRRVCETRSWYFWDTAKSAWLAVALAALPKDLLPCHSLPDDARLM